MPCRIPIKYYYYYETAVLILRQDALTQIESLSKSVFVGTIYCLALCPFATNLCVFLNSIYLITYLIICPQLILFMCLLFNYLFVVCVLFVYLFDVGLCCLSVCYLITYLSSIYVYSGVSYLIRTPLVIVHLLFIYLFLCILFINLVVCYLLLFISLSANRLIYCTRSISYLFSNLCIYLFIFFI